MEDKAYQDDFCVLDVSLAQTLHKLDGKLILPVNAVAPK